ncbi:hypothetical protein [Rhodococcus rhodochrous]|uniref:hypothetical protein n=1 Tax=Rhodococcus rhodochrous TaxID=1829 RepID=UPI001E3B3215|nr:hypothetical protein [Rhodococcus rhodochrous]MCD2096548.1 hypothetical protein [Rhodococcus rhodochrous]MCD2121234.1 hypothetical protein [Rhodococcus rhodochrous]MCQ4137328.1 hypothetical protein [Rhodococcus rhodochrous]MDJ0021179.1 hypothetical protein [Rhodococcus rhodochrous]
MSITEYRNRFADLNARLRRARFDNDDEAITVIEAEMNRILDLYNASRPPSQQP